MIPTAYETAKVIGYDPNVVRDAIKNAIKHAWRVAKEPHQKLDRIGRVAQFVTSIRTRLSGRAQTPKRYGSGSLVNPEDMYRLWIKRLCQKSIWYDIGVLESNIRSPFLDIANIEEIKTWLRDASMTTPQDEVESIKMDLKEASTAINVMTGSVSDMKHIASKGDVIVKKFEDFMNPQNSHETS